MVFDKSRVYTALNADELQVGSKIVAADSLGLLKKRVISVGCTDSRWPLELVSVDSEEEVYRFNVTQNGSDSAYELAYLVEEPEETGLKWTDLKPGDVIRAVRTGPGLINKSLRCLVTSIDDDPSTMQHIYAGGRWIGDTELKSYIKEE